MGQATTSGCAMPALTRAHSEALARTHGKVADAMFPSSFVWFVQLGVRVRYAHGQKGMERVTDFRRFLLMAHGIFCIPPRDHPSSCGGADIQSKEGVCPPAAAATEWKACHWAYSRSQREVENLGGMIH